MPRRTQLLVNGEIYHIYNRSIANEEVFEGMKELKRMLELIDYYRYVHKKRYSQFKELNSKEKAIYLKEVRKSGRLVSIFSYAVMPNHFHLLLRQEQDGGITYFLSQIQNGFAKYYNTKSKRWGSVFQNPFKAKLVQSDNIFLHLSRYIHLNPATSYIVRVEELKISPRTSLPYYLKSKSKMTKDFVNTNFVLNNFNNNKKKYMDFVMNRSDYQRKLRILKKMTME